MTQSFPTRLHESQVPPSLVPSKHKRKHSVFLADVAGQAERFKETVENMKDVVAYGQELNNQERNLFAIAYKNIVHERRASWKAVCSIEQEKESRDSKARSSMLKAYREMIEKELRSICEDAIQVLENHLIPFTSSAENKVFYLKMKGDYHGYVAEFVKGDERQSMVDKASEAYTAASNMAVTELPPAHPIRLAVAVNLSVLYYEILDSPDCALQLARQALEDAASGLETVSEESYQDVASVMGVLKNNLAGWMRDLEDKENAEKTRDTSIEKTET